jgi:hypothetical protein
MRPTYIASDSFRDLARAGSEFDSDEVIGELGEGECA